MPIDCVRLRFQLITGGHQRDQWSRHLEVHFEGILSGRFGAGGERCRLSNDLYGPRLVVVVVVGNIRRTGEGDKTNEEVITQQVINNGELDTLAALRPGRVGNINTEDDGESIPTSTTCFKSCHSSVSLSQMVSLFRY